MVVKTGQQQEVIALVRDSTPEQLGLAGLLWTRDAVAELLARRVVGCWLAETDPAICGQARREGGVVLWLDELGGGFGCGEALLGAGRPDPGHQADGKRFGATCSAPSLTRGWGGFASLWVVHRGNVGRLLRRLRRDCGGRRVHLIVDGHPVHRAKLVSAWLGRHADRIQLCFLPGYRPELDPVELLNHDVQANAAGRRRSRSAGELRDELQDNCVVGSGSHRSWSASSTIRQLGETTCLALVWAVLDRASLGWRGPP
jgi:DDE superfamily endonuclease